MRFINLMPGSLLLLVCLSCSLYKTPSSRGSGLRQNSFESCNVEVSDLCPDTWTNYQPNATVTEQLLRISTRVLLQLEFQVKATPRNHTTQNKYVGAYPCPKRFSCHHHNHKKDVHLQTPSPSERLVDVFSPILVMPWVQDISILTFGQRFRRLKHLYKIFNVYL